MVREPVIPLRKPVVPAQAGTQSDSPNRSVLWIVLRTTLRRDDEHLRFRLATINELVVENQNQIAIWRASPATFARNAAPDIEFNRRDYRK